MLQSKENNKTLSYVFFSFRADEDCLQWFTGVAGTFQTYNYPNQIPDALNYATCFRQEEGMICQPSLDWDTY